MSKRIYTFDDLSAQLDAEIAWRRKELILIKNYIPDNSSPKQDATIRFSVPILYAHFEGFVKQTTEMYLKYVASRYLKHSDLQSQFIALSLTKKINLLEVKNIQDKTKIIDFIITESQKTSNILTKNVIQTKSNLRFDVLRDILFIIGIQEDQFLKYESLVDDLVDARNYIAHGEFKKVDKATFDIMFGDIQQLMIDLKTEIENSATGGKYMKQQVVAS